MAEINKAKFDADGYTLIKNVLTKEEVQKLRDASYKLIKEDEKNGNYIIHRFAKNHIGCLTAIPEFRSLILDDRVIEIATKLLGEKPTFFGDCIMEIGIGNRGFHKDTANRNDQNHPDWTEEYPVIRIAFYLEDHSSHSGGLKVRVGSQNTVKTNEGKAIILPTQTGDAAAFCLRTSHAGNAVRLKFAPNLSLHNSLEKRIPKFLKVPEEKERISIFLTYGLKSGALNRYMEYMFNHGVYKKRILNSNYSNDLKEEITSKVNFIDITESFQEYNN
tara:strand:- start:170659 stop:171483 length:825 start_codon:yes stop_codon:yes gene_type:complete